MRRTSLVFALAAGLLLSPMAANAQVFHVIHPHIVEGGFELEVLNGVSVGSVQEGEERSAHEIALSYGVFEFWKTAFAIEIANPEDESAEFEGFEWENVFLLPFGEGHSHGDHDHGDHGFFALEAIGIFAGLEVPNHGGLGSGAAEIGPIAEVAFGQVEVVGNLVFEFPFEDEEHTGLGYALQVKYPVMEYIYVGGEAYGGWESVFEDEREGSHSIGPAVYGEFDLGRGRILEPRLAVLFGLTDNAPDAVVSLNFELRF